MLISACQVGLNNSYSFFTYASQWDLIINKNRIIAVDMFLLSSYNYKLQNYIM